MYHARHNFLLVICCLFYCGNFAYSNDSGKANEDLEPAKVELKIWPQGEIPYFIDEFSFDKVYRDRIRSCLDSAGALTGLRFIELPSPPEDEETRWVLFVNRRGILQCDDYYATNFTLKGVQKIVIGYDCLADSSETLAAAIMAIAGVPPQHNAPDRGMYLTVEERNILPDKLYLFTKVGDSEWPFGNLDYDFASASHYDFYKYTATGYMTLRPTVPFVSKDTLLIEEGLTPTDITKIKMLYNATTAPVKDKDCKNLFTFSENHTDRRLHALVDPNDLKNRVSKLKDVDTTSSDKAE